MRRLLTIVIATLALSLAEARGTGLSPGPRALHYLAVGVSSVPGLSSTSQLTYAHKDAQDYALLWKSQQGGMYVRVQGELLVNSQATRPNILAALDKLNQAARPGDTVMVSLCGHGGCGGRTGDTWHFTPYDFDPDLAFSTSILESEIRDRLARMTGRGVMVVLIVDCCHAAAMSPRDSGVIVLASTLPNELAQEHAVWDNGVYSKALIEALAGKADLNRDGIITLAEVDAYVSQRMPELLSQWAGAKAQHPTCGRPVSVPSGLPLVQCRPAGNVSTTGMTTPPNPMTSSMPGLATTGPISG